MKFTLYRVDADYCAFLREVEPRVPYVEQPGKEQRPFIGIVLSVYGKDYFAPLTNTKRKHSKIRNSIGFIKIDGGELGAINTINMIPVPRDRITMIDLSNPSTPHELLMLNQHQWCRRNRQRIQDAAQKLYSRRADGTLAKPMYKNCCDFSALEKRMDEYVQTLSAEIAAQDASPHDVHRRHDRDR